jgi:hypothetical protein
MPLPAPVMTAIFEFAIVGLLPSGSMPWTEIHTTRALVSAARKGPGRSGILIGPRAGLEPSDF